jgi:alpha(1,3/1,4) fucosyltransferase
MAEPSIAIDYCDWGIRDFKTQGHIHRLLARRYPLGLASRPDFLIYSHSGQQHRLASAVRVFCTSEADLPPDWHTCDYALTPLYRDDPRHLRLPPFALMFDPARFIYTAGEAERGAAEKTKFCAFLSTYRNAKTRHRWDFFEKLSQRQRVDSGGKAGNNLGFDVPLGVEPTVDFLRPYKFFLAFENKVAPGYIADRLLFAFAARCIPVYYGCPRVAEEFNARRFLNYHDFPSEEALIERILEIDGNDDLLRQYLAEPVFPDNKTCRVFEPNYYYEFFDRVFQTPIVPAAARALQGWQRLLGRWTLAKRDRPHTPQWYKPR